MHDPLEHELAHHGAALRRLATKLVGGADADDVVQETAAQALARPPARPAGLGAWLAAVLRHRAGKHRREQARRARRERERVPPEPAGTPLDAAQHKETIARLHTALLALPEPYAGTLLLRYFEDLSPTAIAARTNTPLATVKSRLQRGLELLRQQLGERRDWRMRLGTAFGIPEAAPLAAATLAAGSTLATGAIMGTAAKLACGGVAAAAAVAWFWFGSLTGPDLRPTPGEPGSERVAAESAALSTEPPERSAATSSSDRERADVRAPAGVVALRGRCVDERGAPLPGLELTLHGSRIDGGMGKDFDREYSDWLQRRGGFVPQDRTTTTAADGTFAFSCEPSPLSLSLRVVHDGLQKHFTLSQELQACDRDLGDLVVPVTCRLLVRVVDERGMPVLSPPLRANGSGRGTEQAFASWPDVPEISPGGGTTLLVTAGTYSFTVGVRSITNGATCEVPPATASWAHEVVVTAFPTEQTITGTVVDELQRPLAGASVFGNSGWGGYSTATTDSLGQFTLPRPEKGGDEAELRCSADGYRHGIVRGVRYGQRDVRVQLLPAASLELTAVDGDDRPVEDYAVRVWVAPGTEVDVYSNEGQLRHSDHHENGVAIVDDLDVGDLLFVVEPHRLDLWRSEPIRVHVTAGQRNRATIRVPAAGQRALRVEDANGKPVGKAQVELLDDAPPADAHAPEHVDLERWRPRDARQVAFVQRTKTDAAGEAQLRGPAGRLVTLRIVAGGAEHRRDGVSLADPSPLVVQLPASGRVVAKIGPPQLVALLREVAKLPPDGPSPGLATQRQPGFRLGRGAWPRFDTLLPADGARVVAGDGTVTFDDVPPGTYELALEPWDWFPDRILVWKGSTVPVATVVVAAAATATVDVDLAGWLPGELTGTVICNGAPVADAEIQLDNERLVPGSARPLRTLSRARTDAEGRFVVRLRAGTVRVLAERGDRNRVDWQVWNLWSDDAVFVPAGGRVQQTFTVTACAVRLRLVDAAGQPASGVDLQLRDDTRRIVHGTQASDADGHIAMELEPGTFAASVLPRGRQEPWLPLGDVTATPGKTTEVTLRLPPGYFR